ncbi:GNAT family N-acetyltransferase [Lentzea sp. NEAU-D7]|uniref:GNAT family N-acetyltransferase n=1 Tax=Lentzea sp. NEAU-D7 TaxID=2994667 RepID=UPI00224B5C67|nr:GNAT family N-acetyltransferase [Lentzea sp. NEAU-D7]MCX2951107.1 GNAT family N-acetyltransferase [Lentzea sp. NEAU-D7]
MIDSTEALESLEQLTVGWRAMVLDRNPDADVRDLPGIAVRWADCRFPFWNCVTLTESGIGADLLAQRFAEAADVMRTKQEFGFLWVFEGLAEGADLDALAGRAGLEHAFPGTGMAGDLLPIPEPSHAELTFERVTTDDQLLAYADINSRAYGFGVEAGRDGIAGSALWKSGVHAYLGLRDGVPVTCAGAVETAGRLFVVLVATEPGWERRGYGEAVTRKALYEAWRATGITRATLHATAAGAPVYPRIGFEPNSPIRFYALKG